MRSGEGPEQADLATRDSHRTSGLPVSSVVASVVES